MRVYKICFITCY